MTPEQMLEAAADLRTEYYTELNLQSLSWPIEGGKADLRSTDYQ